MLGHPQEHGQGGAIRTGTPEGDAALIVDYENVLCVCVASNELFQMYIYI